MKDGPVHADDAEEDELDKLLHQYEAEAEADKRKVLSAAKRKPAGQKGMAELRETGLATPLAEDTKCDPLINAYIVQTTCRYLMHMHHCWGEVAVGVSK